MKNNVIISCLFATLFFTSCGWTPFNEDPFLGPKPKIYKTKVDYFNYLQTWAKDTNALYLQFDARKDSLISKTLYGRRWQLADDYVLEVEITEDAYFTNVTLAELVNYKELNPTALTFPRDSFNNRVIDKDPFVEFWEGESYKFDNPDSSSIAKLNELIEKGELKKEFKKLK